ncbi:MAG: SulP family inorganic anion transporter [Bacteroidota bacterium]|jgi:MFS superfamily sulfate permease-like transporter
MSEQTTSRLPLFSHLKYDIPAGISVFFVAIPLCLGIAHASGAPLMSGLISGVIGGMVVGAISRSALSVTGPAAGLTAIVLSGIEQLGSFELFLCAVVVAGIIQLLLGVLKVGKVIHYIPHSVIQGMLSAIGFILISKQFPHLIGFHADGIQADRYSLTSMLNSFNSIDTGVTLIGVVSLLFMILWETKIKNRYKAIPGALPVVLLAIAINYLNAGVDFLPPIESFHYVQLPSIQSVDEFTRSTTFPDWSALTQFRFYGVAFTIAIVASLESLLSLEAMDELDPLKRTSPPDRELVAQGTGNILAGLLGGIPITAVIVRGTVNLSAGARTRLSAIFHGILLVVAVVYMARWLNLIPIAGLAAVLVYTGYKLLNPTQLWEWYQKGKVPFAVFCTTFAAIVLTDLMVGVAIGLLVHVAAEYAAKWRHR